ncbi:MAG: alternate-type signal peptide domain-containing protein [Bifidobacteriaceae bacterium]|jgi:alternate signal-mediated exported protein|nr:alternate-type signal peptide domain-containing protein [Bifidobacteriaceae bacterium]
MTVTPQTEQDRRKRRLKGLIAGVAGVALLMGGTTFAYWSDSTQAAGGSITNGTLDVEPVANAKLAWYDTRKPGTANGVIKKSVTEIANPGAFKAVPGDTLEIDLPQMAVKAVGDNMKFEVAVVSNSGGPTTFNGWQIKAYVYSGTTSLGGPVDLSALTSSSTTPITVATVGTAMSGNVNVVLMAELPATVANQQHVDTTLDLSGVQVKVTQVTI